MYTKKTLQILTLMLSFFFFAACGGGGSSTFSPSGINTDSTAPIFTSSATIDVNENQTSALTLVATDSNAISYTITGGDAGSFSIDDQTGVITFNVAPDFEAKDTYTFTAIATDAGGNVSNPQTVTIRIIDILEVGTDAFRIKIKTDNTGKSTDTEFEIPTLGNGYVYNVDCNSDGIDETTAETGNYTCEYPTAGIYTLSITGTFPQIVFYQQAVTDSIKLLDIVQWGTGVWRSMNAAFGTCNNMTMSAGDTPNLSTVTNMGFMFFDASIFNANIEDWNVSTVSNMESVFANASMFNQPLYSWNVSSVTSMTNMFKNATSFNKDIGHCQGLSCDLRPDNQGWDVSSVTDMSGMFQDASSFNQYIRGWDVRSVTNMSRMFAAATSFNQDIGTCDSGNSILGQINCNRDGNGWNISSVKKMDGMFSAATSFNQDISNWNVSSVEDMYQMFRHAAAFDQDISGWDISAVRDMGQMFFGVTLSIRNYTDLLIAWNMLTVQRNINFHAGDSLYLHQEATTQRQRLINSFGWTIIDGGSI